jgi:hypothetical protein
MAYSVLQHGLAYRVYTYYCLLHFDPEKLDLARPVRRLFLDRANGARTLPPAAAVIHGSRHRPATLTYSNVSNLIRPDTFGQP